MNGDARTRLIEEHMPLVTALAHRYDRRGEQLEDLVQVDLSQAEIGAELGVSQVRVSRVLATALEKLRGAIGPAEPASTRPRMNGGAP